MSLFDTAWKRYHENHPEVAASWGEQNGRMPECSCTPCAALFDPETEAPQAPGQHAYPEHEKLTKVNDQTQAIGEFLDWAASQGYWLMSHGRTTWTDTQACRVCVHTSIEGTQRCKAGKRCPQCQGTHVRQVQRTAEGWVQAPMMGVLLAQFAGVDPVALEAEKRAMLADLRAGHGG